MLKIVKGKTSEKMLKSVAEKRRAARTAFRGTERIVKTNAGNLIIDVKAMVESLKGNFYTLAADPANGMFAIVTIPAEHMSKCVDLRGGAKTRQSVKGGTYEASLSGIGLKFHGDIIKMSDEKKNLFNEFFTIESLFTVEAVPFQLSTHNKTKNVIGTTLREVNGVTTQFNKFEYVDVVTETVAWVLSPAKVQTLTAEQEAAKATIDETEVEL